MVRTGLPADELNPNFSASNQQMKMLWQKGPSITRRGGLLQNGIESFYKEVLEVGLPRLIGATSGLNEPYCSKLPEILQAKKKEIQVVPISELGLGVNGGCTEIL